MSTPLGVRTIPSVSFEEAKRRVLCLYREWLRETPPIVRRFCLDVPISTCRRQIRLEFEKNRHVQELAIIDILIAKGTMELVEASQLWKQTTHLMKYFEDQERLETNLAKRNFMTKFLD